MRKQLAGPLLRLESQFEDEYMKVVAQRVRQPIGEFYISMMPASILAGRVNNRPRSTAIENSEDIQRIFSEKRINEISDFSRDPQSTFPTPIILALDSKVVKEIEFGQNCRGLVEEFGLFCFVIPDIGIIGDVLDGQHRILGLQHSDKISEFELPVIFMFDLSLDDKAFVFSIINSKQTPVSGSLIYDLFSLSNNRSPQKTCHYIAQSLNSTKNGPFSGRLKMLGRKEEHHKAIAPTVMLSQGTFAARLEELITKNAMEDARLIKEGKEKELRDDPRCPLRKYFMKGDDDSILKIVSNYFSAAEVAFENEWKDDSGEYVIRKTVGYTALIIVLRHILERGFNAKDLSYSFFVDQFDHIKINLGTTKLNSEMFPSSGAGATSLAKKLLGVDVLKYHVKESPDISDVKLED